MDLLEQLNQLSRPNVAKKPWMESVKLILATVDDLGRIAAECIAAKNYGLDIECTGLDARVFPSSDGTLTTNDKIVGICIAPTTELSYYLPIRHRDEGEEANIPPRLVRDMIIKIQAGGAVAAFHNGKFDQEFLEHDPAGQMGDWAEPDTWEDTLLLAYLENSRERRKGLKHLAKLHLDREMIELEELFPEEVRKTKKYDFSTLDPRWNPVVWYAAADAMNTLALRNLLLPKVVDKNEFGHSQKTIYKMEKMCSTATRWMERSRIPIDRDVVSNLIKLGQKEWFECLTEVYNEAERAVDRDPRPSWFKEMLKCFDPNSLDPNYMETRELCMKEAVHSFNGKGDVIPKSVPSLADPKIRETVNFPQTYDVTIPGELGLLMREVGVRGLRATEKSGQVQTSKDELDRIMEESGDEFPFMKRVKRFREVAKALSTNLFPIYNDTAPERCPDGRLWVGFNATTTDTGRFSTPASGDGDFRGQARWNVHSTPATYDEEKPECARKIRNCVRAKPGKVMFAIDYSGVELRIVTNLSGESKWVEEFFRCSGCDARFDKDGTVPPFFCPHCGSDKIGDLHTLTAQAVYGEGCLQEADFSLKRKHAKALNFAMCYGGGGSAAQRSVNVDQEEGWRIKRQFDKAYKGLTKWWDSQHNDARRQQYVLTAFGRKYPVPDIVNPNQMFRSKAERNSVNGPVQGCLHPDSRIMTDLGYLPVKELFDIQKDFQVWTGRSWQPGRALFSGDKALVKTSFESGRVVQTSPEHLFRVWQDGSDSFQECFKWTRQEDLTPNSWVAVNHEGVEFSEPSYHWDTPIVPRSTNKFSKGFTPHNAKKFKFDGNSELLWEFLGLLYGDGSIPSHMVLLTVCDNRDIGFVSKEWSESYCERLNKELNLGAIVRPIVRSPEEAYKQPGWTIEVHNQDFRNFCREQLGVLDQNTYTKRFPKALWSETQKNRAAFLRGYFSADGHVSKSGDAVSVSSVNQGLLQDTQALLNSLGIRSGWRRQSCVTNVLDRTSFLEKVGFVIPAKQTRLENMKRGAYFHQWYRLPSSLIKWAGDVIYKSSIYSGLRKETALSQQAVDRLCRGSGSKAQCLRYLSLVPKEEIPEALTEALKYDYERFVSKEIPGETIPMYDIEVFDEDHAFVCDGLIVHNTSADIMKLAMGLLYREFRKRGWLTKALVCITIHDELVWEIDEDIAEEAVDVILDIMLVKTVKMLGWTVQLGADVEFGDDWTVTNHLFKMEHKLSKWTDRWKRVFPKRYQRAVEYARSKGESVPEDTDGGSDNTSPPSEKPNVNVTVSDQSKPAEKNGSEFIYRISKMRLTPETATILSKVLLKCVNRGSDLLRVLTEDGFDLTGTAFKVSYPEFKILAEYEGL